jgi:hypothetical protein
MTYFKNIKIIMALFQLTQNYESRNAKTTFDFGQMEYHQDSEHELDLHFTKLRNNWGM